VLNKQKLLEKEMVDLGKKRYREENRKAKKGKHEATTPAGIQFIRKGINRVSKRLDEVKQLYYSGTPVPYDTHAVKLLLDLKSDVTAFLALKGCVNHLSTPVKLVKVSQEIGNFIEDEARFRFFEKNNPALFGVVTRDLSKRTTNYRKQKRTLVHSSNKSGLEWDNWPSTLKLRLGTMLCEIVAETTKLFNIDRINVDGQKYKTQYWMAASKESLAWIDKKNSVCELLSPVKMPMLIPPRKWTSIYSGGYYTYTSIHLVKSFDTAYKDQLNAMKNEMKPVYNAVNIVQETAWRVNKQVFNTMDHLFTSGASCIVIPEFEERSMPRPYPKLGTKDEIIEWKREATHMYQENARRKTKRIQFSHLMWMSRKFKNEKRIYFPHTIDFRGRLYASTAFLNPQGEDSARGLLEFSEKKALGQSGLAWLGVHIANCWGEDKVSLEDRLEWTNSHKEDIYRCAKEPLDNKWWMEADKPWQFLRACIEWYKADGSPDFMSSIPVTVDGSCNGLQHFAGMLRDQEGGRNVNLLPNDVPADIYDIVRQEACRRIAENVEHSELWGDDISRTMVKRPVMTTPYGATKYGMRNQIYEEIKKQLDKGTPLGDNITNAVDLWPHAKCLASTVWDSIGSVIYSAREGMAWLQAVAQILAKEDKAIYWHLPTGFLVKQKYLKSVVREVKTVINGRMASLYAAGPEDVERMNKQRQSNGIAPNFIHSYDACHLMRTIIGAREDYDIQSFAVVHDSFGTHASDMEALSSVIRREFIQIYSEDVLKDFRDECQKLTDTELPALPKYGKLKIEEVEHSEYFFS